MPEPQEDEDGNVMAGDRRLSRPDSSLPDWYMSDGAYRPMPIAWFAGALILQVIAMPAIFFLLLGFQPLFTIAAATMVTALIGFLTWERGMADASLGWRIATATVLVVVLGLVFLGAAARF